MRAKRAAVVVSAAIAVLAAVLSPLQAAAAPTACAADAGGDGPFYPGPSASAEYNSTFGAGPAIPYLETHTPQGLTVWRDWNNKGTTILLVGAYRAGKDSYLIGINPRSGTRVGTVRVAESHLGGVGLVGDWLITTHTNGANVRKYEVDDLRAAMRKSSKTGKKPFLAAERGIQKLAGAHFMSVHDGRLWAGRYNHDAAKSRMAQYRISPSGLLTQVGKTWEVPTQTQGVLVTKRRFVFYSGLLEGRITVVERGARKLADATGRCFSAPGFGQNLVVHAGQVYLAYEGGAASKDRPNNQHRITDIHTAAVSDLTEL